jgi:hypothetical protein
MESIDQSGAGYPEEAPPGADPDSRDDETPQREGGKAPKEHGDTAEQGDDGKATGNPHSAG